MQSNTDITTPPPKVDEIEPRSETGWLLDGLDILTCRPPFVKAPVRLVDIQAPPPFSIKQVFRALDTGSALSSNENFTGSSAGVPISDEKGHTIG